MPSTRDLQPSKQKKRKPIPRHIRQLVLIESGYMCGNPRCRTILTLELHHIDPVRDGGSNESSNLIALCPNCHSMHEKGIIPQEAIYVWKNMIISINSTNISNIDTLLHIYKMSENKILEPYIRYSAESLVHFAGLLNSGLLRADFEFGSRSGMMDTVPISVFKIELTPYGLRLVDAWLEGNKEKYLDSINERSE